MTRRHVTNKIIMKRFFKSVYWWFISKLPTRMRRKQQYNKLKAIALNKLEELKTVLKSMPDDEYIKFSEDIDAGVKLKIGVRRIVLEYEIKFSQPPMLVFKTFEICDNEENYGTYKKVHLPVMCITIDLLGNTQFKNLIDRSKWYKPEQLSHNEIGDFPLDYLNRLDGIYESF